MGLADMYDFAQIQNEAEKLVIKEMEKQLSEAEWDNEELIMDIATYALNNLKPAYSHTLIGKLYTQELGETDYHKDVEEAVIKAITKIRDGES